MKNADILRRNNNLKTKNGITLIALVITIIVLLILAGVCIATITGENGLLERTRIAKEKTDQAQAKENNELSNYENVIDEVTTNSNRDAVKINGNILWTNPDSTANFDAQTISLSDNIENYNYYQVIYLDQIGQTTYQTTGLLPVGLNARLSGGRNVDSFRDITEISGKKVTFSYAQYYTTYNGNLATDNVMCIPYQVIGF